ncbi:hypothetical protein [Hymenobacter terrigena]
MGIIYHGDCDYVLHPHCTSFAGDSGVGKSIVADLLQLLFTGPGVYESATRSQQPRKLPGLVAEGLAYAYANVETAHGQYVGIGCYLEASGAAYPFVVHAGYHETELIRFSQPLGFRDFLLDGQIKPFKTWADRLRHHPQGVSTQMFPNNYRRYHQLLYQQHILPLDVGSSEDLLKNYAKIIRSFARSGELEKGTIDYIDFLFGKEAKESIWTDYQKLLEEFERDGREQHVQHKLIEDTKNKVTDFRELLDLRGKAQHFATKQVRYCHYQLSKTQQELSTQQLTSQQHHLSYFCLQAEVLRRKTDTAYQTQQAHAQATLRKPELTRRLPQLSHDVEEAKKAEEAQKGLVQHIEAKRTDAKQVEQWLTSPMGPTPTDLLQSQRQQERRRVERRQLDEFLQYLDKQQLNEALRASVWANNSPIGDYRTYLSDMHNRLVAAEQLQQFNDLNDEDSLARWALTQSVALSREQESILAHFSSLPKLRTRTAAPNQRYLADPAALLALPLPELLGSNESGFWLDLRGVGEWILRLKAEHCIFFNSDKERITALLAQRAAAAEQTVEELRGQVQVEQQLQEALEAYGDWLTGLRLYARREELAATAAVDAANMLPEESKLHEMLQHYADRSQLEHDWQTAQHNHNAAVEQLANCEHAVTEIQKELAKCDQILQAGLREELDKQVKESTELQQTSHDELIQWLNENHLDFTFYQAHVVEGIEIPMAEVEQDKLIGSCATYKEKCSAGFNDIERAKEALIKSQKEVADAEQRFQKLTGQLPQFEKNDNILPEPNEVAARKAEQEYETCFRVLATPLGSNGTRLTPGEPAALIQRAVPDAVKTYLDQPEEALHELLVYLEEISAQSNQLTEHKLNRLGEVLNRVRTTVTAYRNEIQELESYFRRGEAGIAGGFSAKLRVSLASEYPLEWLHHFQDMLRAKARGEVGALDGLRQSETLLKLMRAAYIEKGGKNQQAIAEELLDPKSYLRLTYHMEAEGQINHGSTGQTFMAAALLNIARLSLIGRDGRLHKRRPGIRFMPIDEAAGLGSNYNNLLKLAAQQGYQVVSLAIEPVLDADPATVAYHRIYVLGAGQPKAKLNLTPMMLRGTKAEPINEDDFYASPVDLFTQP